MVRGSRSGGACGDGFDRTNAIENLPQFLTVEEVACYLGVGRTLAYSLVRNGALPVVRFGRVIRIARDHLRQMTQPLAA